MKKKVELKRWMTVDVKNPEGSPVHIYFNEMTAGGENICLPCTITFEIEVPEPRVEVTPSMIDEIIRLCAKDESFSRGSYVHIETFKKELFGRPSESVE